MSIDDLNDETLPKQRCLFDSDLEIDGVVVPIPYLVVDADSIWSVHGTVAINGKLHNYNFDLPEETVRFMQGILVDDVASHFRR